VTPALSAQATDLLAGHPHDLRAIELRLRELVLQAVPDAREIVDTGDGLLAYALGPRMRDLLFAIIAHRSRVNLQPADGVELPDPGGLVEAPASEYAMSRCRWLEDCERAGAAPVDRRAGHPAPRAVTPQAAPGSCAHKVFDATIGYLTFEGSPIAVSP
jgi:hypothetical protein